MTSSESGLRVISISLRARSVEVSWEVSWTELALLGNRITLRFKGELALTAIDGVVWGLCGGCVDRRSWHFHESGLTFEGGSEYPNKMAESKWSATYRATFVFHSFPINFVPKLPRPAAIAPGVL
jgi:hypothetical protein